MSNDDARLKFRSVFSNGCDNFSVFHSRQPEAGGENDGFAGVDRPLHAGYSHEANQLPMVGEIIADSIRRPKRPVNAEHEGLPIAHLSVIAAARGRHSSFILREQKSR
jgi:hypothetical protein